MAVVVPNGSNVAGRSADAAGGGVRSLERRRRPGRSGSASAATPAASAASTTSPTCARCSPTSNGAIGARSEAASTPPAFPNGAALAAPPRLRGGGPASRAGGAGRAWREPGGARPAALAVAAESSRCSSSKARSTRLLGRRRRARRQVHRRHRSLCRRARRDARRLRSARQRLAAPKVPVGTELPARPGIADASRPRSSCRRLRSACVPGGELQQLEVDRQRPTSGPTVDAYAWLALLDGRAEPAARREPGDRQFLAAHGRPLASSLLTCTMSRLFEPFQIGELRSPTAS